MRRLREEAKDTSLVKVDQAGVVPVGSMSTWLGIADDVAKVGSSLREAVVQMWECGDTELRLSRNRRGSLI